MTENEPLRCGGCGAGHEAGLFFITGGWGFDGNEGDGRLGLCAPCGATEPYRARFTERFGIVQYVTDSDAGTSADSS